jgi:hypothetical protein
MSLKIEAKKSLTITLTLAIIEPCERRPASESSRSVVIQ